MFSVQTLLQCSEHNQQSPITQQLLTNNFTHTQMCHVTWEFFQRTRFKHVICKCATYCCTKIAVSQLKIDLQPIES